MRNEVTNPILSRVGGGGEWRDFLTKISALLSCIGISVASVGVAQIEIDSRFIMLRLKAQDTHTHTYILWTTYRGGRATGAGAGGAEIKQLTRQHLTRITCHSGMLLRGKLLFCQPLCLN